MNRFQKIILAAAAAGFMVSRAAVASPITFDLTQSDGNPDGLLTLSSGGVSLTATGYENVSGIQLNNVGGTVTLSDTASIVQDSSGTNQGIGVNSTGFCFLCDVPDLLDDVQGNEVIKFVFSELVRLVSITFSDADSNDDFNFIVGNILKLDDEATGTGSAVVWNAPAAYLDIMFGVGADDGDDDFQIRSIVVDNMVAPVPEPGALALLGVGLAGIGWARRRRTL